MTFTARRSIAKPAGISRRARYLVSWMVTVSRFSWYRRLTDEDRAAEEQARQEREK
nr:hypothetical protein [Enterobacter hormaechei]